MSSLSSHYSEEQPHLPSLQPFGSAAGSSWMRAPKCPGQEGSNELEICPPSRCFPLLHSRDNAEFQDLTQH